MASVAHHHAEWLALVEINGPFLSMGVLLNTFPQGLDAHDSDHAHLLRTFYDEWLENTSSTRPDTGVHKAWIDFVLKETLGFTDEVLVSGQRIPENLALHIPRENETLRPSLVLLNPAAAAEPGKARLLIDVLPASQGVEKAMEGHRWKASPASRMLELLKGTNTRLGLITNGEQWMLVNAAPGESAGYITWTSDYFVEEPLTLRAFRSLLGVRRFFAVSESTAIEALLDASLADSNEVTDQLGYQVRKAVEVFIQAVDRIDQDCNRELLRSISPSHIYEAALTVMMRLVFLFSAEERGLFLLGEELYDQCYAVSTLRAQLQETADQQGEEILSRRSDAWCRLLATFRAVYGGLEHDSLRLPTYGGNLFDPDRFPFLEGRSTGTHWQDNQSEPLPINNQVVLHLLAALQVLQVKVPGGKTEPRRLSFSALGVEQIGHVYEGLLDHAAVRATSPVIGLIGSRNQEAEVELAELERLKQNGQEALVDYLKKITGRQASTLKRSLEAASSELADQFDSERLLQACNNDVALCERVSPFARLIRSDTMNFPVVIPTGNIYVTKGSERRSSGTYYTPPSLIEPIVKHVLDPLVYIGPAEGLPEPKWRLKPAKEILDLKVCDMAMGSGAFLVQVCRYLAEKLVEAWADAEAKNPGSFIVTPDGDLSTGSTTERLLPVDVDERILIARRFVADKCIYGVDKNDLAVNMAKLSLWLVTLQRDRPFTFLDHALKHGDSLLGVSALKQIENFSLRSDVAQMTFATANLFRYVEQAASKRRELEALPSNNYADIEIKNGLHAEAEAATTTVKAIADHLIAFELRGLKGDAYDDERTRIADEVELLMKRDADAGIEATNPKSDLGQAAYEKLNGRRTFHWPLEFPEVKGVIRKQDEDWIVTLFMVNARAALKKLRDTAWVFQPELSVESSDATDPDIFVCKAPRRKADDSSATLAEDRAIAMLYRKQREFAVGHGVGTETKISPRTVERATRISTKVIPGFEVPKTTPPVIDEVPEMAGLVLDMKELSESVAEELGQKLAPLTTAYTSWIERQRKKIDDPQELLGDFKETARRVLENCTQTLERIQQGIELLTGDKSAAVAFKFMNKAMWLQRVRSIYAEQRRRGNQVEPAKVDIGKNRTWYPFQLAFILLNLPSLTDLTHQSRVDATAADADLLWFPTGGGKTEAYLGLTAYALAIRRLQGTIDGRSGEFGVAVLMRYTLRLLTLQQFQRASALICACESIRRDALASGDSQWGREPFRIGLWVGLKTTPNKTADAEEFTKRARGQFYPGSGGTPHQLNNCPWCGYRIDDGQNIRVETFERGRGRTLIFCGDPLGNCLFTEKNSPDEGLPVMVVDEEIYRRLPSLLIATVDKFAQMPWKGPVEMLFGRIDGYCERHGFRSPDIEDTDSHNRRGKLAAAKTIPCGPLRPPDLIIQDELHLISGPLGTLVGLYETAVDKLATWELNGKQVRPKVIASTATIRAAESQVRGLFLRQVKVFPPQGLDVDDNFFSRQREPGPENPGRKYIGVCASGRRLKAALIRVYVALLAAAQAQYDAYGIAADPWMTLVGYFNSLRELGGMRRLVDDDVRARLGKMDRRGLAARKRLFVDELTSRKSSIDIPQILDQLEVIFDPDVLSRVAAAKKAGRKISTLEPLDVILATNMVSVGVDVKRLGAMVVAGQPKSTAEYIQSTSRVGRSFPGLVITVYNWARPRDLSHYEGFEHYHAAFYKHVEALSVTPFSFGSIDRGLSALLVGLVRLYGKDLNSNGSAANIARNHPFVKTAITAIAERSREIAGTATQDYVSAELERKLDTWLDFANDTAGGRRLGYEFKKDGFTVGLLKDPYAATWEDFTCLRSLRNVEPTVGLMLVDDNSNLELSRQPQPMPQDDELKFEETK